MNISVETTNKVSQRMPFQLHNFIYQSILRYKLWTQQARYLPDTLIIGAQKAGTTSLFAYLVQHSQFVRPLKKEIYFFDRYYDQGLDWYKAHFYSPIHRAFAESIFVKQPIMTGEASTHYLFNPVAPERASKILPNAKIIAILRNPTERAFSAYKFLRAIGIIDPQASFEDVIIHEDEFIEKEREDILASYGYFAPVLSNYAFKQHGLYEQQLQNWLKYYPREQILILVSDDLYTQPHETFSQVCRFLGISPPLKRDYPQMNPTSNKKTMSDDIHQFLDDYYHPHNQALEALLEHKLDW